MKNQEQPLFAEPVKPRNEVKDEFAESCRPLAELLDSVRHVDGFPLGKDEDILALSDPPYYTACPNPYINDFVKHYGTPYDEATDSYERTPFVADVSEGKNDPIYNAHSYHTKVPHKAIMRYIEHYTEPGDIVFDGFCGSGMTGVAAQLLERKAILSDLSPAASFIAYNYNSFIDSQAFERATSQILDEVEKECGWMYETLHTDGVSKGRINYVICSDVYICPYCDNEYVFWNQALDTDARKVLDEYKCPHCKAKISKKISARSTVTYYDDVICQEICQAKQVPVLINYSFGKKRYEKKPDDFDEALQKKIAESKIPYWFPIINIPEGYNTEQPKRSHGFTHLHHFFTKRNLWVMAAYLSKTDNRNRLMQLFVLTAIRMLSSKNTKVQVNKYFQNGQFFSYVTGTLYIPSLNIEGNPISSMRNKLKTIVGAKLLLHNSHRSIISADSMTNSQVSSNSIDYIFTDPPFGNNLMYSELNFFWESWLKVFTNNREEAIMNERQQKKLPEYKGLMLRCFKEMYRILKPNRWITVEFHNSSAAVWNAIQEAMTKAGFVVAQVSVLDKKQGSFKQVTSIGAVKNDLVINAYKPKHKLTESFLRQAGSGLETEFVGDVLNHLPVELNIGRTEQMLYSKMLAHYVQHGFEIRLDARAFYRLLADHFKLVDGCWFTDKQVLKYEEWKKKQGIGKIREIRSGQQAFVSDERSAIIWLYHLLEVSLSFSDIHPLYLKALVVSDDAVPDLRELLDRNFIMDDGKYRRPQSVKEKDTVSEQRDRDLAKVFEQLLNESRGGGKKLKSVRKEAIHFGFARAYQEKRFSDIIMVAKKLDPAILEANGELNDFVEIARLKAGDDLV